MKRKKEKKVPPESINVISHTKKKGRKGFKKEPVTKTTNNILRECEECHHRYQWPIRHRCSTDVRCYRRPYNNWMHRHIITLPHRQQWDTSSHQYIVTSLHRSIDNNGHIIATSTHR